MSPTAAALPNSVVPPARPAARQAIDALLRPHSIAVVGASAREGSFGARLLASLTGGRYDGVVIPINPGRDFIAGHRCYPSLAAVPEPPDCAAFALSDDAVEAALEQAAAAGIRAGVIFGRAYDPEGARVQRLAATARAAGMAICGNNCMGFFNAADGIKMSGNPPPLPETKGVVGLVSHSGSTWSGLIGNQRDLAFNYAISAGQEIATGMAEYIEFLLDQPETQVIACILETMRDPERFIAALERADRRGIPVVALKLGRTERGRSFALAHSGALAGSDHAYGAVFERHNVIRVHTPDELTDMVELLRCPRRPPPGGIGIVTDSGGERELIVDLSTDLAAPLAEVTPATSARLVEILDPGMQPQNPVDAYGDGRMLMQECLEALADDPGVGVIALATNLVHGRPYARQSSTAIELAFDATEKPALVFGNIHSTVSREEATRLRARGIPVLMGTSTALTAMRNLIAWQRRREQPRLSPALPDAALLERAHALCAARRAAPVFPLPPALDLLDLFAIPSAPCAFASTETETKIAAAKLGFPVVLKTASPGILHKTEAGGVALGLADADSVTSAYRRIAAACGPHVQLQAHLPDGVEILLGMTNDAQFGPMVTVASGGILTELLADAVTFQPPLAAADAATLLRRLRAYRLLEGYRGRPPADIAALSTLIERFSLLCATVGPHFSAIDLNPIIVGPAGAFAGPNGAVAADALFLSSNT